MKCEFCGYEIKTPEEILNNEKYSCAKAKTTNSGYGHKVELCFYDRTSGKFYDPGTNPNDIYESPDALKEGTINMIETNAALKAKALEAFQKALDERDRKAREKQKPKT